MAEDEKVKEPEKEKQAVVVRQIKTSTIKGGRRKCQK
jgi:hypothetical protein